MKRLLRGSRVGTACSVAFSTRAAVDNGPYLYCQVPDREAGESQNRRVRHPGGKPVHLPASGKSTYSLMFYSRGVTLPSCFKYPRGDFFFCTLLCSSLPPTGVDVGYPVSFENSVGELMLSSTRQTAGRRRGLSHPLGCPLVQYIRLLETPLGLCACGRTPSRNRVLQIGLA